MRRSILERTAADAAALVELLYTCHLCGIVKEKTLVRARREEQDVVVWLKEAAAELGAHHHKRSPSCPSEKVDIYIPAGAGVNRLGGPVEQ